MNIKQATFWEKPEALPPFAHVLTECIEGNLHNRNLADSEAMQLSSKGSAPVAQGFMNFLSQLSSDPIFKKCFPYLSVSVTSMCLWCNFSSWDRSACCPQNSELWTGTKPAFPFHFLYPFFWILAKDLKHSLSDYLSSLSLTFYDSISIAQAAAWPPLLSTLAL